ncbi:sulfite exporter TauE/SafE family protein [Neoactinobaculum massilliense]|uniref:sulfite exporter TauE/SafE family protein n=1 Tax=Neoactinobaculum massilliense TaxID=2364794 RepID=UPI000F53BF29|nr:sulfite exporter TauE/SafE family protein [Neoactinobaculum massilliense]
MTLFLVFLIGLAGGLLGYLAGVASLITYPGLLLLGFPPVIANTTNAVSNLGNSIGATVTGWRGIRTVTSYPLWPQVVVGAVGGTAGAALLLAFDPAVFEGVVPWLVLLAVVSVLIGPEVRKRGVKARVGYALFLALLALVGVYGGYFGAASAVLYVGLAAVATSMTTHEALLFKAPVIGTANLAATVYFLLSGAVDIVAALVMAAGGFLGGALGPYLQRFLSERASRAIVAVGGFALFCWLLYQDLVG